MGVPKFQSPIGQSGPRAQVGFSPGGGGDVAAVGAFFHERPPVVRAPVTAGSGPIVLGTAHVEAPMPAGAGSGEAVLVPLAGGAVSRVFSSQESRKAAFMEPVPATDGPFDCVW